jgi:S-formylglutathione hydrolase FrmB
MATLEFQFYSKALKKVTTANVILPEIHKTKEGVGNPGNTYKTLYLLHGLSGDHTNWLRKTSIERYANEYGIAVVMPDVGRSWYTDTAYGEKYFTFVAEELPTVCRSYFKGMSDKREDNYIAGLSMGGYGAMKIAMSYPENYCGCATLSGALDITRENRKRNLEEWKALFGYDLKDFAELNGTKHDVYALVDKNHKAGNPFPKLFVWCGTEDELVHNNRRLKAQLDNLGIEHYYAESEGDHSWKWWDLHIQEVLKFFFA